MKHLHEINSNILLNIIFFLILKLIRIDDFMFYVETFNDYHYNIFEIF